MGFEKKKKSNRNPRNTMTSVNRAVEDKYIGK